MSAVEKAEVLARVASSSVPKREVLSELGVPRSTYCRWLRGREQQGLEDHAGGGKPPWNRLTSREVDHVLSAAREMPELSPRQLATWVTDNMGFSVSESTVYRILCREVLVKRPEIAASPDLGQVGQRDWHVLQLKRGGEGYPILYLPHDLFLRLRPVHRVPPFSEWAT